MLQRIQPASRFEGLLRLPGDKSVSHRSIMMGSLAYGTTEVENFLATQPPQPFFACVGFFV